MEPTIIADYKCETGEGPLWHPDEGLLYWTDIPTGRMFRYNPATGHHEQFYDGDVVGGFTLQKDGALLLFMAKGAVKIWRDGSLTTVIEEIEAETNSRFNDVSADPTGRVFCGTMSSPDHAGTLYRLDLDASIRPVVTGVGTSNGMGFTPDLTQMYHTDTGTHEIYRYDYDEATGEISNRQVFVHVSDDDAGRPDGMTVDAEGCIWSARWEGSCIVRYTPDGKEERRIQFPATKMTSIAFGGPDYTDMFISSAGGQDKAANGPGAGALFHLNLGIKGVPEFRSNIPAQG